MEVLDMSINRRFWKHKKVLVTGHEGFLGSWLTKTLTALQAEVTGIDRVLNRRLSVLNGHRGAIKAVKGNINNYSFMEQALRDCKPQVIFHLAAEAIVEDGLNKPIKTFKTNIQGAWNVLEAARGQKSIEAIVMASSDKAYGAHKTLPYTEAAPLNGRHPYDASKSCADILAQTYYHTYALPVCITRCGNIYGPGDRHFSRIVPEAIRRALNAQPLEIRSDGKYTRDYIYVEDVVDGYLMLAQNIRKKNLAGEAFNFSDEHPLTVLELCSRITAQVKRRPVRPVILNQARNEIRDQYLSSRKSKMRLGWKARHSLQEGLDKTIEWYQEYGSKTKN